jgi:hypothetical protein
LGDSGAVPAFCAGIQSSRRLDEYNPIDELSETERRGTKAKESKFSFFCFAKSGLFSGLRPKKVKKILPPAIRLRVEFSTSTASLFPPQWPRVAGPILRKHYHRFLFYENQIAALVALAVGSIALRSRGCPRRGRPRRGHPRALLSAKMFIDAPRPPASAMLGLPAAAAMAAQRLRRRCGRTLYQVSMIGSIIALRPKRERAPAPPVRN